MEQTTEEWSAFAAVVRSSTTDYVNEKCRKAFIKLNLDVEDKAELRHKRLWFLKTMFFYISLIRIIAEGVRTGGLSPPGL